MRIASAIWCAVLLVSGCAAAEEAPFADKGAGEWIAMKGVPELAYRAVWGVNEREMYAVGDGGVAVGDGNAWRLLDDVPAASYRAIWGRSASEIWIGGDGILLARSPTGWRRQAVYDGSLEVVDYSVMALGGDRREEYAIVVSGGERLLLVNDGSAWRTALWRSDLPSWPLPPDPSLFARDGRILVGGAGDLVRCSTTTELGIPMWEAYRWPIGGDLPRMAAVTGGDGFWAGAGGVPGDPRRRRGGCAPGHRRGRRGARHPCPLGRCAVRGRRHHRGVRPGRLRGRGGGGGQRTAGRLG